ncbi:hypothetical protein MRS44_003119 [Fusarium solani]|jgi:hypothetical protein|uniref:uncharacterized protein n=1 Tax=Fusarium solani TaxID=169388 RepID=UPI002312451C|nr:hypothetical protein MRS44_003119 [Fusarium solani]KAJ4230110.1 hypothetical protein NW759_003471 [Fusarium solani]
MYHIQLGHGQGSQIDGDPTTFLQTQRLFSAKGPDPAEALVRLDNHEHPRRENPMSIMASFFDDHRMFVSAGSATQQHMGMAMRMS